MQQLTRGSAIQDLSSLAYNCYWDTKVPTWLVHNCILVLTACGMLMYELLATVIVLIPMIIPLQ